MCIVEIRYPHWYEREYRINTFPSSKLREEKYITLLKRNFAILGKLGKLIAKKLLLIPGTETKIAKDSITVRLLGKHKWRELEEEKLTKEQLITNLISKAISEFLHGGDNNE